MLKRISRNVRKVLFYTVFLFNTTAAYSEHSHSSATSLSEAEADYLNKISSLTLCSIPDFPPFEWVTTQGQHKGLFAGVLAETAKNAGLQFRVAVTESHHQSLKLFETGQCDLVTRGMADNYSHGSDMTQAFFTDELGFAVSADHSEVSSITDINGLRVGAVSGTDDSGLLYRYPNIDLVKYKTLHAGMEAVISGSIDAMVAPLLVLREDVKHHGTDYLVVGGALGIHQDYAWQVSAQHASLVPILNKALSALTTDKRQHLIHHNLHQGIEPHVDRYYLGGLVAVVIVLLVMLYRYRHLWQRSQQLEHTLEDSEKRFQRLADNAPDMLFRMTLPEGVYEYVSPAAVDIFGYTQEEFLNTPQLVAKITHNEWTDYVSERWSCAIQGDTPSGCEFQIVHKSGALRWLSQRCTIIKDEQGNAIAMEGIISDITERKRMDAALSESERRYRTLLDSSPDWIWEVDANGVYTYASPKVKELLGYEPEEVIGKTPFDLMRPAEAKRVAEVFAGIAADKSAFQNLENSNLHKSGHQVVLETSGTPIIGPGGELLGYRGVDRDITLRKQNEHELRTERDFNSTVLEAAGNVIVVLDMKGNFIRFNRAAEELTGYNRDEVIGHPVWEIVIPEEQRDGVRGVFRVLSEGKVDLGGEYENEWLTRKGDRRLLHWHNSVLLDDDDNISFIVAQGYDITEQKQLEHNLRSQEQELAQIIDHIPNMIFLKEADELRYVRFNKAGEELTGVSRDHIIGKNDHDFFPAEQADFFNERDRAVLNSHDIEDIPEEPLDTPHGTRTLHTRKVAIRDENGDAKYLLGISDDITERKEQERERERLQRELQQAQKMESLGQLTGGIAHDFNNLLGIINGYAGLAYDNCVSNGEEKLASYMQHLKDAGGRATNLVSQMLAFSRNDQSDDAPIELAPLLKEDIKMLRSTLPTTINMVSEIEAGLPPVIMNPTQLHQILMNLSINARDAMTGVGTLTIKLGWARDLNTVSPISHKPVEGDWIELSVSDTGSGIDAKTAKNIFNPFFTTKEVGKGTGMGLSVIYGIMENHYGHILLDTEEGVGSTFRMLFLPHLDKVDSDNVKVDNTEIPGGNGEEILVVDDELSLGVFMAELLKSFDYKAEAVADSAEALELFEQQPDRFSLLITDQTMPNLTGVELITAIRKIKPNFPSILCTGYSDKVDAGGASEMDIPFFEKPVDENKLLIEIANRLKSQREG